MTPIPNTPANYNYLAFHMGVHYRHLGERTPGGLPPGHPYRMGVRLTDVAQIVCRRLRGRQTGVVWSRAYDRLLSFAARRFP